MNARRGSDFLLGVRLLGRGFGTYVRRPRLLLLGLIPAVLSLVVVLAALAALIYFIDDIAALVTWFADDWSTGARDTIRVVAGFGLIAASVLVSALVYTALTLLIGDPFYEVISEKVEERLGGTPGQVDVPWYRSWRWNLADSLRLILFSVLVSIPLFAAGFIPIVGQTVVPVINAIIGGWLLTLELTGIPFNRRGLRLKDRRRLLRANRSLALGFGIPTFLLLLIPVAAIFVIPAAVVGGTLLTRTVLDQPTGGKPPARREDHPAGGDHPAGADQPAGEDQPAGRDHPAAESRPAGD